MNAYTVVATLSEMDEADTLHILINNPGDAKEFGKAIKRAFAEEYEYPESDIRDRGYVVHAVFNGIHNAL